MPKGRANDAETWEGTGGVMQTQCVGLGISVTPTGGGHKAGLRAPFPGPFELKQTQAGGSVRFYTVLLSKAVESCKKTPRNSDYGPDKNQPPVGPPMVSPSTHPLT